jgi:hypothetical protein
MCAVVHNTCVCVCVSSQTDVTNVAFTAWSISAVSAPHSVPCYSAVRICSRRHFCPVNKCKNRYCVFVKKFNIFTYGIYCSRGRGVILRPSCPFRQLPFCEHRNWTHFRRLLKQISEVCPVAFFWFSRLLLEKEFSFSWGRSFGCNCTVGGNCASFHPSLFHLGVQSGSSLPV